MKIVTMTVEMSDDEGSGMITVTKVTREQPEHPQEAVNSVPVRTVLYKGEVRAEAKRIHDEAQAGMFR